MTETINVVTGILITDGRIFLQQRRHDDRHAPLMWETPGGKVEPGETDHDALRRELREELGIRAVDIFHAVFWSGSAGQDGARGGAPVAIRAYVVPGIEMGWPEPREGQAGFGWFTRAQLASLAGHLNYGNEAMLPFLAQAPGLR